MLSILMLASRKAHIQSALLTITTIWVVFRELPTMTRKPIYWVIVCNSGWSSPSAIWVIFPHMLCLYRCSFASLQHTRPRAAQYFTVRKTQKFHHTQDYIKVFNCISPNPCTVYGSPFRAVALFLYPLLPVSKTVSTSEAAYSDITFIDNCRGRKYLGKSAMSIAFIHQILMTVARLFHVLWHLRLGFDLGIFHCAVHLSLYNCPANLSHPCSQ